MFDVEGRSLSLNANLINCKLLSYFHSLVHVLRQPNVRDASGILAEQVDVRVQDCCVNGLTVLPQDCLGCWSKVNVIRTPRNSLYVSRFYKLMIHNYHYRSKICGNPFPPLNYLEPPARTRSSVDHRFSCKTKKERKSVYSVVIYALFILKNSK